MLIPQNAAGNTHIILMQLIQMAISKSKDTLLALLDISCTLSTPNLQLTKVVTTKSGLHMTFTKEKWRKAYLMDLAGESVLTLPNTYLLAISKVAFRRFKEEQDFSSITSNSCTAEYLEKTPNIINLTSQTKSNNLHHSKIWISKVDKNSKFQISFLILNIITNIQFNYYYNTNLSGKIYY